MRVELSFIKLLCLRLYASSLYGYPYSIQGSVELRLVPTASRQTIIPAGEADLAAVCIAYATTRRNAMAMK